MYWLSVSFYNPYSGLTIQWELVGKNQSDPLYRFQAQIQSPYHMSFIINVLETEIPPSARKSIFVKVAFPQEFSTQEKYFHLSVILF